MEKVYGVINKVTYYDEDKGFGIVRLKLDYKKKDLEVYRNVLFSNIVSVLSNFDRKPFIDEEYEFMGDFETSNYGIQFRAKSFKRYNEQSKEGIITYFSSEYFPGIGKVIATKVYEALGKDCIKLILNDRSILDKVEITSKQKDVIYENLVIRHNDENQLISLLNLGITFRMAIRIIKIIGNDAYETVKANPYQLIDLIEGVGFIRADTIAMNIGISKASALRMKALICFSMQNYTYSTGNTYIPINDLFIEAGKYVNNSEETLTIDNYLKYLEELVHENRLIIEDNFVFDYKLYHNEYIFARKVFEFLQNDKLEYDINQIPDTIDKVMNANNIIYSDKQVEAIKQALIEPILIITGGPGTGKSTIIKGIIETYSNMFTNSDLIKEQIVLIAPTGRASKRLKEVTKHNAMTIHKLLGYEGGNHFTVTPECPIEAKMIIIDEFSMVDITLASILFSVVKPETRIIIVGDADQLPSVGPGNVLHDLIETKEITTIKLEKIHRQASDSSIITLAHSLNHSILPEDIFETKPDRSFIRCDDQNIITCIEKTIESAINKNMDLIRDIQLLVPIYRGDVGIDAINYHLQDKFNPATQEITYNNKRFRINDKVIQLVNRSDKHVMNGDIGYVLAFATDGDRIKGLSVMYDFGKVDYDKEDLDDLNLAYAISVHKSQGSEFPLIIMPFSFKYFMMLKRKLIYTGITRAKKYLVMIGNFDAMRKGIIELEENRKTQLVLRIKEIFENPNIIKDKKSAFEEVKEDLENISPYDFM